MGFGRRFKQARYIYTDAKFVSAEYRRIAYKHFGTESHSSLSNMIVEGVMKSAINIIRAFVTIVATVMFPQLLQP